MKDIQMIDREIDILMWLEDSINTGKRWKGKQEFFRQFNAEFIRKYAEFGKHKLFGIKKTKTRTIRDTPKHTQKALRKMNTLLELLSTTTDHTGHSLMKLVEASDLNLHSRYAVDHYLAKLLEEGAIEIHQVKPRVYNVLNKSVD